LNKFNKIGLGTVQFGLNYGVTNKRGRIPGEEIEEILSSAKENGMNTLDTASGYGASEEILGSIGVGDFKVYTKIPNCECSHDKVASWIEREVCKSLSRLKLDSLEGLYLHDPKALDSDLGNYIYKALLNLRERKFFKKIGLSIYSPNEYKNIENIFPVDILQFPLNIFDQRFLDLPYLEYWKSKGIEIHTRSVFLQGVLLQDIGKLPSYFSKWNELFSNKEEWRKIRNLDLVSSCLYPIISNSMIDTVLIGVESIDNFNQISESIKNLRTIEIPGHLSSGDPDLIFPYNWKIQ
jgi:aryl-alcohol dehydrogenase-like predicted oxidoreductase